MSDSSSTKHARHLASIPSKSLSGMAPADLLALDVEDFTYTCDCGAKHHWSIKNGRLIVDDQDVTASV